MSSWKILVVDDDQDILRIIRLYLQNKGYEVFSETSGQAGIDRAKSENPDLIILDAMMPGLDGIETMKLLREDETTKQIPIIMCTARNSRKEVVQAARMGVSDYIVKPFAGAVLLQKVAQVLSEESARTPASK